MTNIVQMPHQAADWSAIVAELCEIIDVKPMRYMAIEAAEWPVQREMLYDAAESTSMAQRPSWAYLRAIVNRCIAEGCTSSSQYQQRQLRHAQRYRENSPSWRKATQELLDQIG